MLSQLMLPSMNSLLWCTNNHASDVNMQNWSLVTGELGQLQFTSFRSLVRAHSFWGQIQWEISTSAQWFLVWLSACLGLFFLKGRHSLMKIQETWLPSGLFPTPSLFWPTRDNGLYHLLPEVPLEELTGRLSQFILCLWHRLTLACGKCKWSQEALYHL